MSTSVPAVKAALVTLLEATFATDADPVTVIYGPRGALTVTGDRLFTVGGANGTSDPDSLESDEGTFAEDYVLDVVTSVDLPGAGDEGQQQATEAALDLWTRARAAVKAVAGRDLGLAASGVLLAAPSSGFTLAEQAGTQESPRRTAAVRWGVRVIAQRS